MKLDGTVRHYVYAKEVVRLVIPHSEVCVYMQIAGKEMDVKYLGDSKGAQILHDNGTDFSFPVTCGEAGFYWDGNLGLWYCYPVATY